MQKLLLIAAAIGVSTAPAAAQTTPAPAQTAPEQAAAQQPKPAKKIVCHDVDEERGIGSRLARTTKICKEVEVRNPANAQGQQQPPQNRDGSR